MFNPGIAWLLLLDPNSKTSMIGRANHEREEARKKFEKLQREKNQDGR